MKSLEIGLSALRTHQQVLATLGNNIANASTPGYHRQRVDQANRAPSVTDRHHIGSGVEVARITRMRNQAVETGLLRNTSQLGYSEQTLQINRQIETLLSPSESSIHTSLSDFFNGLEKVSNTPQDLTVRREFLSSAASLANSFNDLDKSLSDLQEDVHQELASAVEEANLLLSEIGSLNEKIFEARSGGSEPNDFLDQRDVMITRLGELIDVEEGTNTQGRDLLVVGGGAALAGQRSMKLELIDLGDGQVGLAPTGIATPMPITGGKIRALIEAQNETIPDMQGRLAALARQIVRAVDQQHAKGVPDTGAFTVLLGQRAVASVTDPLNRSDTEFPVTAGDVYVTVTAPSGNRTTTKITIDPSSDSLQDIASRFDAITGLTASVDSVRGTITFTSEPTFTFDFAGRVDNVPNLTGVTGTAVPGFLGAYTGTANDEWTVTYSGAGTIGVTPGLNAIVKDSSGQIVASLPVGENYVAGTPLLVGKGVSLKLANGTVNAADTFSVSVIANSDETGMLSALGINSMFSGSNPGGFAVREDLLNRPQAVSGSVSGTPGDASNFARIAGLRGQRFTELGSRTFVEEMADLTADSGLAVQAAESQSNQLNLSKERLEADRAAVSGVDINEEMLKMMETQRAYQAAAKFITVIDGTLTDLLQMTR